MTIKAKITRKEAEWYKPDGTGILSPVTNLIGHCSTRTERSRRSTGDSMRYKWNLRSKYKDGRVVITPFTTSKNIDHVRYVAIKHYIEHSGIQSIEISKFLKSGERFQGEIVFKQWNPGKLDCFWVKNGLKGRLNRNGTMEK